MPNKIVSLAVLLHKKLIKLLKSLPSTCPLCQIPQTGGQLCRYCFDSLEYSTVSCSCCAEPLAKHHPSKQLKLLCGRCQKIPPAFNQVITRLSYKAPLSQLIQNFKFSGNLVMLPALVHCLEQQIQIQIKHGYQLPQAILCVPLHSKRLKIRGFNQSQLISKEISRIFSIKFLSEYVLRDKLTNEQTKLNRKQRQTNMKNAFKINKPIQINGKDINHVAIIDDVITSGSTCNELAKTLKSTGVTIVDVWCIAKTPFIK